MRYRPPLFLWLCKKSFFFAKKIAFCFLFATFVLSKKRTPPYKHEKNRTNATKLSRLATNFIGVNMPNDYNHSHIQSMQLNTMHDLLLLLTHLKAAKEVATRLKTPLANNLKKEIKSIEEYYPKLKLQFQKNGGKEWAMAQPLLKAISFFYSKIPNLSIDKIAYIAQAIDAMERGTAISLTEEEFRRFESAQGAIKTPTIYVIAKSQEVAYEYIDTLPDEQAKVAIACTPATFQATNSAAIAYAILPSEVHLVSINCNVHTASGLLTVKQVNL